MKIRLLSCGGVRPDRRAIAQAFEAYALLDPADAREQTEFLLEGSEVELDIDDAHQSSAFRALRKHQIEYEMVE